MSWKPIKVTKEEMSVFHQRFKKKARFLLDENLDPALAEALHDLNWKVETVEDIGLKGRSDEDVLAYAQRKNRILITNDLDFRNERRFPPFRNPGVIIIPQDLTQAARALGAVLPIVGKYREVFRGDIVEVNSGGTISIRSTKSDGRRTTMQYRFSSGLYALEWEEEPTAEE